MNIPEDLRKSHKSFQNTSKAPLTSDLPFDLGNPKTLCLKGDFYKGKIDTPFLVRNCYSEIWFLLKEYLFQF